MQDLKLVGVHDDGEHLVLTAPTGDTFALLIDDPLRAAVRLDRARLGQLQIQTEGRLRPRDIQARIRAGASAEEIAEAAGVPLEHVRRFEGPVLAEREFVVRQAQAVRVRQPGRGATVTLGELVEERLAARAVENDAQVWDAWRGDDGVWIVSLTFTAGGRERQARWSHDAQLRHVVPQDDEARWLTEDEDDPSLRPRHLTSVTGLRPETDADQAAASSPDGRPVDRVYDVEADGGVRPVDEPRTLASGSTVDLLDSLRERRGRRLRPGSPAEQDLPTSSSFDPMDAALHGGLPRSGPIDLLDTPPAAHPPVSRPDQAFDDEILAVNDAELLAALGPFEAEPTPAAGVPGGPAGSGLPPGTPGAPGAGTSGVPGPAGARDHALHPEAATEVDRSSRRARRASVPKWDDIVFGSRRE